MMPDFQTIMLPLLKTVSDGKQYKKMEIIEELAKYFNLNERERSEMLPSVQRTDL
jgi:restriction system protein